MTELAEALRIAMGGQPDPSLFHALAASPEEARELAYQDSARRREAALLARGRS